MNKSVLIAWGTVLIIILLGVLVSFLVTQHQYSSAPSFTDISFDSEGGFSVIQNQGKLNNNAEGESTVLVTRTANGYEPKDVVIKQGDIVEWKNETDELHWPASNRHPIHGDYPEFDPMGAVVPGGSWKFQFDQAGVWGYHDHMSAYSTGTVTVQ